MSQQIEKLVIYAPYAIWGPHFETELELAQRHLDTGGEVVFLYCAGELLTCFPNQRHRRSVCRMCLSRFRKGIAWLGTSHVTAKNFLNISPEQQQEIDRLLAADFFSLEDVRSLTLHGADVGVAAISSVVSILREPDPDVVEHLQLIRDNLRSAARAFFSLLNHLQAEQPDRLIVFNGRYAQLRPAVSVAKMLGVEVFVHERAGVLDRFSLTCNATPHDITDIQKEMLRISSSSGISDDARKEMAHAWFEERRNNVTQGWESFTKSQKLGHLPELSNSMLNLVVFVSSEDEMVAFEEWRNPYYSDQNIGIEQLLSDNSITGKYKIFVREHPNLKGINNSQTRKLRELCRRYSEYVCFIPGDSPISTYSLIDACDLVLTYGSTVGIEAVYSGKPSFLMGRAYFENLGCCVVPGSHSELIVMLNAFAAGDRSMLPSAENCHTAVTIYGSFNKLWGHTFLYARVLGLRTLQMIKRGQVQRLRPSLISWLLFQAEELLYRWKKL